MRTIVISDIHGYYRTFVTLLSRVNYNPSIDKLILLGDYVDGGPAALEVVRLVQSLVSNSNVFAIGGNHDDLFLRWLDEEEYPFLPYLSFKNGGIQTVQSFCPWYQLECDDHEVREYIKKQYPGEVSFLRSLPNFHEDDRHIYVHAGIDPKKSDWKQTSNKDFRWIRGRFYRYDGEIPTSKTIIFGHEVCSNLQNDETNCKPWLGRQIIGIDGGIKFGKCLNALIIEDNGEYHSVSVESKD
ncbi:metallophosphoesterase family protein [Paenibacillus chartarius]|uniref:Metallophosphoesterase family protein n=1 Tax=Paenibacillus chartarius TaxID=747481 RepID=A0ABV6DRF0_9BACL